MTPKVVRFYAYAENDDEVKNLEAALLDFAAEQYNRGAVISANKLAYLLQRNKNCALITQYFK